MTLRLDDDDDRMLTMEAARTGRSKQEISKEAIQLHLTANEEVFEAMLVRSMQRHAELLERLA
ncbi:CopG family transcriptional regulator [Nocardia vinacea]|uniref:CopG family transcriptional regulator n=1 Tax=Nocardia vinacea TaxID=96468 RepID=A0ABZ1Z415_9NOCA|nr:CopG family transcriptional regulator [Nocardia vinacea]